jgi:hypothetical protein
MDRREESSSRFSQFCEKCLKTQKIIGVRAEIPSVNHLTVVQVKALTLQQPCCQDKTSLIFRRFGEMQRLQFQYD